MFIFPANIFNPKQVQARIVQQSVSGGVALTGVEDTILSDGGGRWRIDYSDIALNTPARIRAWEVWNEYLGAGTVDCLVPLLSLATAPRPFLGKRPARVSDLYTDDEVFPTLAAYSEPYIVAATTGSAALRATQLGITVSRGDAIKGGEKFGIGNHAYRIGARVAGDVWNIAPPLREAVAAGTSVNFDYPLVRCRSLPGEDFSPTVQRGRFADSVTIGFVEVAA